MKTQKPIKHYKLKDKVRFSPFENSLSNEVFDGIVSEINEENKTIGVCGAREKKTIPEIIVQEYSNNNSELDYQGILCGGRNKTLNHCTADYWSYHSTLKEGGLI